MKPGDAAGYLSQISGIKSIKLITMRSALLFLIAAVTLISCSNKKKNFNGILKPSNIASQYFTVTPSEDAIIHTSHAGRFFIQKGTFETDEKVTVEIKEIYTPDEILLSGLTTLSTGKPLASAGMIYFNATANSRKIEPSFPVKAFIPANNPVTNMKLFSGEIKSDSTINWVDPKKIASDPIRPRLVIQPDTVMKVSDSLEKGCLDTIYVSAINTFPEYESFNGKEGNSIDTIKGTINQGRNFEKKGYNIEISANGWYNIDAFKGRSWDRKCKMSVEVKSEENIPLSLYLFVPTERVMIAANEKKDNRYAFSYNEDKTIPLPFRHRAILLGFNSPGKRIMYGAAEFTIVKEQVISMELKEISKRALIYLIASKNLNGIEIEAIEKEMQIIPCDKNIGGNITGTPLSDCK
ncbi:MAG: hypothetical protein IPM85_11940 [Chitinophagaceae bacterium]|nr:hypothetical protein [Chitinophagaceae bacterium]